MSNKISRILVTVLSLCALMAWHGLKADDGVTATSSLDNRQDIGGAITSGTVRVSPIDTESGSAATLTIDGSSASGWSKSSPNWRSASVSDGWHTAKLTANGVTSTRELLVLNSSDVVIHNGRISANETWQSGKTHVVKGDVIIPLGVTVTIGNGAVVKFCPECDIKVEGVLNGSNVVFTAIADDGVGGDTDCNGRSTDVDYTGYGITGSGTVNVTNAIWRDGAEPVPPADWVTPDNLSNSMTCNAVVKDQGGVALEEAGSQVAFFDAQGACRGVLTLYTTGWGSKVYSGQIWSNEATETGLTAQVWNGSTGEVSDINGTFTFTQDTAYGTAAKPVELVYGVVSVTWNLNKGWNWVSANVTPENASITDIFAGYSVSDGDQIKSKDGFSTYYASYKTWDPIISIAPGKMYAILRNGTGSAQVTVSGAPLKADNTLALVAGWNWIGAFTNADSIAVTQLKHSAGFSNNDQLKGRGSAFTTYYDITGFKGWDGTLSAITAGSGYKLYVTKAGTLSAAAATRSTRASTTSATRADNVCPWVTPTSYANSMTMSAVVKNSSGVAQEKAGSTIGIFDAQGNCRGVATIRTGIAGKIYDGQVWSDQASENGLVMKHWDGTTGVITDIVETIDFVQDTACGSTINPKTYTLKASAPQTDYTVTINGQETTYKVGDDVTLYAPVAPSGQKFDSWSASGVVLEDEDSPVAAFTMPATNVTLNAQFTDLEFTPPTGWNGTDEKNLMTVFCAVKLPSGVYIDDDHTLVGCFDSQGRCYGIGAPVDSMSDSAEHCIYYLQVGKESTQTKGLTLKFWNELTDEKIVIADTLDYVSGKVVGEETPVTYTTIYNLNDASNPESPYYNPALYGDDPSGTVFSILLGIGWENSIVGYDYKIRLHNSSTVNYDKGYDSQMPPRTPPYNYDEYAYFLGNDNTKLQLDTRPAPNDTVTWTMTVVVPTGKPATLTWDASGVPELWDVTAKVLNSQGVVKNTVDALATEYLTISTAGTWKVTFTAVKEIQWDSFTHTLKAGWNLITPTLTLNDDSKNALMALSPMLYNVNTETYTNAKASDLVPGAALWVYSTATTTLELKGTAVSSWTPSAPLGWSFLGAVKDVSAAKVPSRITAIWTWTPAGYRQVTEMTAGTAYWVLGE